MSRSSSSGGRNSRGARPGPARPRLGLTGHPISDCRTVFVTGTDTGVGKTIVTGLLLDFLRRAGIRALAVKPFATGDRGDARRLNRLQPGSLTLDEVNPFFFRRPVAPWVAARCEHRLVSLGQARRAIAAIRPRAGVLLVEGCGGLLAPLGEDYTLVDLMAGEAARVIVVAANRLGAINQARLTVERLHRLPRARLHVALVDTIPPAADDPARASNGQALHELLAPVPITSIPYLGARPWPPHARRAIAPALARALSEIARIVA